MAHEPAFIPAASFDWLLPLYDPLQWLLGGDAARQDLVTQAALRPGHRILDVGCGTGSLAVQIARRHPDIEITGIDPDPKALGRAARKVARAGVTARFDRGFADRLPYANGTFDRVFSSFMLHHLGRDTKLAMLREARRVLQAGGSLHVLDFGTTSRSDGLLARLLRSAGHQHDHFDSNIPELMRAAGFTEADEVADRGSLFGRIAYYRAVPPHG